MTTQAIREMAAHFGVTVDAPNGRRDGNLLATLFEIVRQHEADRTRAVAVAPHRIRPFDTDDELQGLPIVVINAHGGVVSTWYDYDTAAFAVKVHDMLAVQTSQPEPPLPYYGVNVTLVLHGRNISGDPIRTPQQAHEWLAETLPELAGVVNWQIAPQGHLRTLPPEAEGASRARLERIMEQEDLPF